MKKESTNRYSNFELLRIISILLIICFHFLIDSNNDITTLKFSINNALSFTIGIYGILGVSCFTLISAYFLLESKNVKFEKILKIVFQTIFYSIILGIIFDKLNFINFNLKEILKSIGCVVIGEYWYITAYIMLYMIHIFLNKFVENITESNLKILLIILTIIIGLWRMIYNNADISGLDILIYIYLFMGYLKKKENNWFERNRIKGFIITTFSVYILTIGLNILGTLLNSDTILVHTKFFITRSSVLLVLDGVFLFYIFKNLKIRNYKIINLLASASLGTYIIHESRFFKQYFYDKILKVGYFYDKWYFIFYMILGVILIYLISVIIDIIRQKTIEKIIFREKGLLNKLANKINKKVNVF